MRLRIYNVTNEKVEEGQDGTQNSAERAEDKLNLIAGHAWFLRSESINFGILSLSYEHSTIVEDGRVDDHGHVRHAHFEVHFSCEMQLKIESDR